MDSMFSGLFNPDEDEQQGRQHAEDFVRRVETGDPAENVSDEEAVRSYSNVASKLSPNELEDAATQALERFSPEQRREFAGLLQKHGGEQAAQVDASDPRQLAQATTQLQNQQPNGLVGLLGGGGSIDDILGGLMGGGSQGGGGGIMDAIGGLLGGGDKTSSRSGASSQTGASDLLSNPIAKAILAAIAAMAMKKFMGAGSGGGGGLGDLIGGGGDDGDDARAPRRRDGLEGGETRRA